MTRARVHRALTGVLAVAAVAACWASAGAAPLTEAARGIDDPADFVRDYVTARVRLEDGAGAPPGGPAAIERSVRLGAPAVMLLGGPFHLHPPPGLLPVLAVAWLPWRTAAHVWALLSLLGASWLSWSLLALLVPDRRPSATRFALTTAALVLWPPTLHCLEKGQWSIWLAAFLAAGFVALERERPRQAGVLLGVAASLKATPLVLVGLLLARSRRAAVAMVATVATLALVATAVGGLAPWRAFFADAPRDVAAWATWLANTASLQGVFARLFASGPFTRPLAGVPDLSRAAFALTSAALLGAVVVVGWGRRARLARSDGRALPCWSAAWLTLPVLLNPLGWSHVVLMLLAPLAVAFRDGGPRTRAVAVAVLAALSVPRQRLMAWAGPMPVPAAAGLVLGLHAFAAVALCVALLGETRADPTPAPG